jgi:hypothetical protein
VVIFLAIFIYPVSRVNASKKEAFSMMVLPFEVMKLEGSLFETNNKPNINYDTAQVRE